MDFKGNGERCIYRYVVSRTVFCFVLIVKEVKHVCI